MKKLLAGFLLFGVLCFGANVSLACDCGCCDRAKIQAAEECVKKDCDCGCKNAAPCKCKSDKACDKKCDKPCDQTCDKACDKKCDKPCDQTCDKAKSVSDIIDETVSPVKAENCESICPKAENKCKCSKKAKKHCKKSKADCAKKGCPLEQVIEQTEE